MQTAIFDNRLRELSAMVGSDQSAELFNGEYETLLNDIRRDDDLERRTGHAARMKKLLLIQAGFLMNAWMREHTLRTGPMM